MKRGFFFGVLGLILALPILSSRGQQGPDFEGQPTQLREGAIESYWIWHDYDGYHIRTTTSHDKHVFHGQIQFSREPGWVKASALGPNDYVRVTGQGVEFHLVNQRNLSGFDFRVDYQNQATLHLELDDRKGPGVLEHVFVGRQNAHPVTNPFTVSP